MKESTYRQSNATEYRAQPDPQMLLTTSNKDAKVFQQKRIVFSTNDTGIARHLKIHTSNFTIHQIPNLA